MISSELLFTKPCIHCGMTGMLVVPGEQALAWANGAHVQTAFPNLDIALREQIISGIHPSCWTEMFPTELEESGAANE